MNERLNYKECREKVFILLDESSILSREDISTALSLRPLVYYTAYCKFRNFLSYTRKYAFKEYAKSKDEKLPVTNIIFFRDIINKDKGNMRGFIRFCELERIPLLYYLWQIKKYIFPNEFLISHIHTIKFVRTIKGYIRTVKQGILWGFYISIDDIINKTMYMFNSNSSTYIYMTDFLRNNFIIGESTEEMFTRLGYDVLIKKANDLISKNLYTIANLELVE